MLSHSLTNSMRRPATVLAALLRYVNRLYTVGSRVGPEGGFGLSTGKLLTRK